MPVTKNERRRVYLERKKKGCCPRCGTKLKKTEKFTFCDDCRAFFRAYCNEASDKINKTRKIRYKQRKQNDQCPRCGKKLGRSYDKTICPSCLSKQYKYNYNSAKPGKTVKKSATAKKAAPKKAAPKRAALKKPTIKKAAAKKAAPKKPTIKKAAPKKSSAKKTGTTKAKTSRR